MGDTSTSDSWKKLVIAKANNQWISIPNVKKEHTDGVSSSVNTDSFSLDYQQTPYGVVKTEVEVPGDHDWQTNESYAGVDSNVDPLSTSKREKREHESSEDRALRLAKMSAYAAQRLANETPEQRAARLKRMSQYAAKRLASETIEQRAKRLARMSAYAAKRLALETPEQRQARLARMSAYAAKRHALKKLNGAASKTTQSNNPYEMATITRRRPDQS